MNVSPQQVNKWLKGKENFTFETVSKIEDALNIELLSIQGFESKHESSIKLVEIEYTKRSLADFNETARSIYEIKYIPFRSNKVSISDYNKVV